MSFQLIGRIALNLKFLLLFTTFLVTTTSCTNAGAVALPQATPATMAAVITAQPATIEPVEVTAAVHTKIPSPEPTETKGAKRSSNTPPSSQDRSLTTPTARPTLGPDSWKELPVVPQPGERVVEIYKRGLELGNNPYAFSKVGDCGSTPAWFLGDFDRGEEFYSLGEFEFLKSAILAYQGSFERTSLAARSGFTASSLLTTLWTDLEACQVTETPLECEYRQHKPVIAFITLGTNDIWLPEQFEPQMRKIIEYSIDQGVIPVLATKADNAEGDGSINATVAKLAFEYDIPLWNYWLAVQPLPDHGLQEDQSHLTWGRNFFDVPENMTKAWPVRNLTALQVLFEVWKQVSGQNG